MGLFDKLREVFKSTQKNGDQLPKVETVETAEKSSGFFSNEIERTYYEIAYDMLSLFSQTHYDRIKKYVEYHTGQPCDEAKLEKALSNLGSDLTPKQFYWRFSTEDVLRSKLAEKKGFNPKKIENLIEINRSLDESKKYRCSKEEAFDIFYNDIFPEIKSEYEKVLEISESHGINHFREGIYRITEKYKDRIGRCVFAEMIRSLTREKFIEGNHIVRVIVIAYLNLVLRDKKTTYSKTFRVASVALRALHFEAFGQEKKGYSTISEEDCREFVFNNNTFKSEIDRHPYDTDKYTNDFVNSIIKADLFNSRTAYDYFWMPSPEEDPHYADMVCSRYWKSVAAEYEDGESTDPNDVYNILWDDVNEAN